MKKHIFASAAIALALCSCGSSNEFSVKGNIEGANDKSLKLESSVNGYWIAIDSTRTNDNGNFKLAHKAPHYPEIYRLTIDGQSVYFPIDSLENISLNAKLSTFGSEYILEGSEDATNLMKIDKKAQQIASTTYPNVKESVVAVENFKRELAEQILANPTSIVSYYIINKQLKGAPLFDTKNTVDMKIIGAVANAYNTYKQGDPRTKYLVDLVIEGQKLRRNASRNILDTIHAEQSQLIDIKLQDNKGVAHQLSAEAAKGKVILLNFTVYGAEASPALNKLLGDIYAKYKSRGFEIVQIGYDTDIAFWKQAAANLPWLTLYDGSGANSPNLMSYNVGTLPMSFIIDSRGQLSERVANPAKIESALQKYF